MLCKTTTLLSLAVLAATTTATSTFGLRGLQVGNGPPETADIAVSIPNQQTELDYHLDTLLTKPECGSVWTSFADTIATPEFGALPMGEQTKHLDVFCQTPCGPSFKKATQDWRDWRDTPKATYLPLGPGDEKLYTFDGFIVQYGCGKSAGSSGMYCAKMAMEYMNAEPMDLEPKCAYYSSCCFGEMHRLAKLDELQTRAASLDAKCPGARAALASKCA